jgi:hypothetical protein
MHKASDLISNITHFVFLIPISYADLDKDIICAVYSVSDMRYMTIKQLKKI